jgi:ABC-type microcin C transport system duplicated ATPase subunit YejF
MSVTDTAPILSVEDLQVAFRTSDGMLNAVKGLSFDLRKGETLAIIGESGSGKSQTAMALMGLLASNGQCTGSAMFQGLNLIGLAPDALDRVRGSKITMIFQEPMTSLDPLYTVGQQMAAPLVKHSGLSKVAARERAIELLDLVQIRDASDRIDAYPHELSGGQRQRVMIAMAIANEPDILIADEPTTALDVIVQAQILDLLDNLQRRLGLAIIFITHDLRLVRDFADHIIVMKTGQCVENGRIDDVLDAPQHPYTRMLIEAEPQGFKVPVAEAAPVVLEAFNICVSFQPPKRLFRPKPAPIHAVDNVSISLREGETIGIVGESGSGKSTLGRALLKLIPSAGKMAGQVSGQVSGQVHFDRHDLQALEPGKLRGYRRDMQLVFQDPFGSLSPRLTAGEIVTEGLLVHEPTLTRAERDTRAIAAFDEVQLDALTRHRFPHEFSGGQRQRIAIARAMILRPKLVVLDEPTSALDRSVQSEIVTLLRDLQERHRLAYVFISHDLAVVRAMSDRYLVMRDGRIVEEGLARDMMREAQSGYARELIRAAFGVTSRGTEVT